MVTSDNVIQQLGKVIDPELRRPITELNMVDNVAVNDDHVDVRVLLTTPACPLGGTLESAVTEALLALDGVESVSVSLGAMDDAQRETLRKQLRGGEEPGNPFTDPDSPTRVLAVASGKGGVGKSTISANLATELARRGYRVGLVDADIYGFSIPRMMGITQQPVAIDSMIVPPIGHGVKTISIGMFIQDNAPVMWRGPMLHRAIQQFFSDVFWDDLDFLLLDLPPGTGDVAMSVAQLIPRSEILVVTTPQASAAAVAERAGSLGGQTGQRVVGVVENMSYMVMPDGTHSAIFGTGGGARVAKALSTDLGYRVPLLGEVPLEAPIGESSDAGMPYVLRTEASPARDMLRSIADGLEAPKVRA